jgi:thymidylate synthase ThyX
MKVNLVSYTRPAGILEDTEVKTLTDLVAYCARVSNPANQINSETSEKLIKYLIKNKHWSPLEMADITLEIETTRDIARQMLRHKSFFFQEFCIAGDSRVTTILPATGAPNYISIEKLYERQSWKNYKDILLRVYDEKEKKFVTSKLKEVFKTGKKECYKTTLESGQTITSTKEHKFLTPMGFKTLEEATNLRNNGGVITISADSLFLATNGVVSYQDKSWLKEAKERYSKIKTIEYVGELETYDLEVESDSHNYVANKFVVHNSQRYSDVSALGDMFEIAETRLQDSKNRQGSLETNNEELITQWNSYQQNVIDICQEAYQWALEAGLAKEVARKVLPEGLTRSRLYMKGSIRSWIHYLEVRGPGSGTQKEHMLVAQEIAKAIIELFPVSKELNGKDLGK